MQLTNTRNILLFSTATMVTRTCHKSHYMHTVYLLYKSD